MNSNSSSRLPIPQYVMTLAHAAALRSEDPYLSLIHISEPTRP